MNRKSLSSLACTLCMGLTLVPVTGWASLVMFQNIQDLVAKSDRVVVGEVISVDAAWDAERKRIYTTALVQVAESWKGGMPPAGRLKIVQPGGSVGDIEMRVHGMPSFTAGERALLFLRGNDRAAVVGMAQGKRALRRDAAGVWLVAPADLSGVLAVDQAGRVTAPPAQAAVPLDRLRADIRSLVLQPGTPRARDDQGLPRGKR